MSDYYWIRNRYPPDRFGDEYGRYAYDNQPKIAKWNLARFAECLIPLIDKDEETAVKLATDAINNFENIYETRWLNMMRDKLGLFGEVKNDKKLILDLLDWMKINKADFTNTFCYLMNIKLGKNKIYLNQEFTNWLELWHKRVNLNNLNNKHLELMKSVNPIVIPRNHKVEEALKTASEGNIKRFNDFLKILQTPYENKSNILDFQNPAPITNEKYQTFCGT